MMAWLHAHPCNRPERRAAGDADSIDSDTSWMACLEFFLARPDTGALWSAWRAPFHSAGVPHQRQLSEAGAATSSCLDSPRRGRSRPLGIGPRLAARVRAFEYRDTCSVYEWLIAHREAIRQHQARAMDRFIIGEQMEGSKDLPPLLMPRACTTRVGDLY